MKKEYAPAICKALQNRIGELRAVDNMLELSDGLGKWHPLEGPYKGCWGASLTGSLRIVVSGEGAEDHEYKWELVTVVCVEEITNYHGK